MNLQKYHQQIHDVSKTLILITKAYIYFINTSKKVYEKLSP